MQREKLEVFFYLMAVLSSHTKSPFSMQGRLAKDQFPKYQDMTWRLTSGPRQLVYTTENEAKTTCIKTKAAPRDLATLLTLTHFSTSNILCLVSFCMKVLHELSSVDRCIIIVIFMIVIIVNYYQFGF